MKLKVTKTYANGATHAAYVDANDEASYIAKIDKEDEEAGAVGKWEVVVRKVY